MRNQNRNDEDAEEIIRLPPASVYLQSFFKNLYEVTGFRRSSFTAAGLQQNLKRIAKRCYEFNVCDKVLKVVLKIAKVIADSKNESDKKKSTDDGVLTTFVNVLHSVIQGLAYMAVRGKVVVFTKGLSIYMEYLVLSAFSIVCFFFSHFTKTILLKLKNWLLRLLCQCNVLKDFLNYLLGEFKQTFTILYSA